MANGNNAVVSAKASLNEARGMFNIGDLSKKDYMLELKKAKKVLTPKQIQDTIRKFDNLEDVPEKARSFKKRKVSGSKKEKDRGSKKKKVSGSDIRVPRKGRPITPEAADASRRGEGIRVKRDIDGGKRLTGWKESAEKDIKSRWRDFTDRGFETNIPADKRPWNRRFEFPGRAEHAEALEKERRKERRKRISKQNKGGLPKKPKFMKGGSYKGKSHMYAAGGMVKELKM